MTQQQFVSVPTLIKGLFRMVEGPDSPQYCLGLKSVPNTTLREELLSHSRLPDVALRFLIEMDRKLDTLLTFMQRDTLVNDFPYEGRIVELSGSGLTLECKEPLAPDDYMELLLQLEELPLRVCSVIARVESALKGKSLTGVHNTAFRMSYTCLHEEDREAIIGFVFREDRRRIRKQKGED